MEEQKMEKLDFWHFESSDSMLILCYWKMLGKSGFVWDIIFSYRDFLGRGSEPKWKEQEVDQFEDVEQSSSNIIGVSSTTDGSSDNSPQETFKFSSDKDSHSKFARTILYAHKTFY